MRSSTMQDFKPAPTSWDEDMPEAPQFEGSIAPDELRNAKSSIFNLLCSFSETNDAIVRDFCCGVASNLQPKEQTAKPKTKQTQWDPVYEFVGPDNENGGNRRRRQRCYSTDCDSTIGGSTLGDQSTVYDTDCSSQISGLSSQISGFQRAVSVRNVREVEDEASRAYGTDTRPRTQSFTESDPGLKKRSQSARKSRRFSRTNTSSNRVRPPRPSNTRRHFSAAPQQS